MNKEVEKIRKEIERLAQVACNNAKGFEENRNERAVWLQQEDVCKRLLSFIDSLQEEPVSENLEAEANRLFGDCKVRKGAFCLGVNWKEQQMIQDAIEREVKVDAGGYPFIEATELYDYENDKPLAKAGDKVKVVFIKDK